VSTYQQAQTKILRRVPWIWNNHTTRVAQRKARFAYRHAPFNLIDAALFAHLVRCGIKIDRASQKELAAAAFLPRARYRHHAQAGGIRGSESRRSCHLIETLLGLLREINLISRRRARPACPPLRQCLELAPTSHVGRWVTRKKIKRRLICPRPARSFFLTPRRSLIASSSRSQTREALESTYCDRNSTRLRVRDERTRTPHGLGSVVGRRCCRHPFQRHVTFLPPRYC
jgi:hypothetical protein